MKYQVIREPYSRFYYAIEEIETKRIVRWGLVREEAEFIANGYERQSND